jgi:predicted ATPase with chaperone activity
VALEARKRRRERLIVPHQNAAEAAVVDGLSVFGAKMLTTVGVIMVALVSPRL